LLPAEFIRVRGDVVLAIHRRQLAEHGGSQGARDLALVASALARPRVRGLASLAAACAFRLIANHPFLDGNGRTAYVVCRTILALNGADLQATKEEKYATFLALAAGRTSQAQLASWIRARLRDR
jgi:death-on-curing protein